MGVEAELSLWQRLHFLARWSQQTEGGTGKEDGARARPQLVIPGSIATSNSGVPREEKCRVPRVCSILSVQEVMGTERSRPRPVYEGEVGLRLEDGGVSNARGVATLSQEQDRAFPSRSEHSNITRPRAASLEMRVAQRKNPAASRRAGPSLSGHDRNRLGWPLLIFLQDNQRCLSGVRTVLS